MYADDRRRQGGDESRRPEKDEERMEAATAVAGGVGHWDRSGGGEANEDGGAKKIHGEVLFG